MLDSQRFSGIVADPDGRTYWVHEDAGNEPTATKIDADGLVVGELSPLNVGGEDLEDLGLATVGGQHWLYFSDAGDAWNVRKAAGEPSRKEFQIWRLAIPGYVGPAGEIEAAQVQPFRYPDGANRNSEAMLVQPDGSHVLLLDKTTGDAPAGVWTVPFNADSSDEPEPLIDAEAAGEVPIAQISGGNTDPHGRFVVLRDPDTAYLYPLAGAESMAAALQAEPTQVPLPEQKQGEGIAVTWGGDELVISSEGASEPLRFVPIPADFLERVGPAPEVVEETADTGSPLWRLVVVGLVIVLGVAVAWLVYRAPQRRSR